MNKNTPFLPTLDSDFVNLLFAHIYQYPSEDIDPQNRDFIIMLQAMQDYNRHYRRKQYLRLIPLADASLGPFDMNSEETDFTLGMLLAIREMYDLEDEELVEVLHQITV